MHTPFLYPSDLFLPKKIRHMQENRTTLRSHFRHMTHQSLFLLPPTGAGSCQETNNATKGADSQQETKVI